MKYSFAVQGQRPGLLVDDPLLVVAGFAGRDDEAVQDHVAELQKLGIPAPTRVPSLFTLPNWLLQVDPHCVQVSGEMTSGEVEPVLIRLPTGELYVTVGSDHTDRALESVSFGASKSTCPKIIAGTVWPFEELKGRWDQLCLQSTADEEITHYQNAPVSLLREPHSILAEVDGRLGFPSRPLILFLGTVPVVGEGFRYASRFEIALRDGDRALRCSYRIEMINPLEASLSDLIPANAGISKSTS